MKTKARLNVVQAIMRLERIRNEFGDMYLRFPLIPESSTLRHKLGEADLVLRDLCEALMREIP